MTIRITPMLVFTVSYLAIFVLLMGMMPVLAPNLLYGGKEYESSFNVPSYFSAEDIENIKYFENETLTHSGVTIDFNPDINIKIEITWRTVIERIFISHTTWEWWVFYTLHDMEIDIYGGQLYKQNVLDSWDTDFNASIFYPVVCSHLTAKVWLTDTNHTRNDIGEAWDNGVLEIGMGFGLDDVVVGYSAWNLVGLLLTFQSPEIFGASGIIAVTLNLIANSPIYLAVAYLVFYFITSIIPFIRGA